MSIQREPGETSFPEVDEVDAQWKDPDDPDEYTREAACDDEPAPDEEEKQTGASQ
jgi:hypothetical protein